MLLLSHILEKERGDLLGEVCRGHEVRYKLPTTKPDKFVWKTYLTSHCNTTSLVELPYNQTAPVRITDSDDKGELVVVDHPGEAEKYEEVPRGYSGALTSKRRVQAKVKVCLNDDAVGMWPRFAGVDLKDSKLLL